MHRILILLCFLATLSKVEAEDPSTDSKSQQGYSNIVNRPYLIPDFDQKTFENLWQQWPEPEKSRAEQATPEERHQLTFEYYGLTPRPEDDTLPLQYVVTSDGNYYMNCFSCHGGQIDGQVIPGLPNSNYAIQLLTNDTRKTKLQLSLPLSPRDLSAMFFPMGGSVGTTNAVMFGVALEHYRDHDMNVVPFRAPPSLVHHDMDAPPWWHFKKKKHLYIDGFVEKSHRALMPFVLIRENDRAKLDFWEPDFEEIETFLESVEAPAYPYQINKELAAAGQRVFQKTCAECHGTYGDQEIYPERAVPLDEIGTDPVRFRALSQKHRMQYGESWLSHYGQTEVIIDPIGYVAPPLDGIWATAPYLHNGSVPTLAALLNLVERPKIWKRSSQKLNQEELGLSYESVDRIPKQDMAPVKRIRYFESTLPGKSSAGHDYPDALTTEEKRQLLEYLKTL